MVAWTPRAALTTLIELLVVLAALALLLGLAVPRYVEHVERARETVLQQNLAALRDAIDKFAPTAAAPAELAELARGRCLREVPRDPITERSDTWVLVLPPGGGTGQVYDVHGGAKGFARDGKALCKLVNV